MLIPYLYLTGAALGVGTMAILRRHYQNKVGSDLTATLLFSTVSSFSAFLLGLLTNGGFEFEPLSFALAFIYAGLSTVTAILCIVAAKYGSASSVILYGSMGTLVLPSCFGLLFDPSDAINFPKILGFLFASAALLIGFIKHKDTSTSSKQMKRLQIAIFFSNGMALVVFKLMSMLRAGFNLGAFITEYMLISAAASLVILALSLIKKNTTPAHGTLVNSFTPAAILIALVYAAAFFISDSFSMKCTTLVPLTIQAPLSFCLPILFTAILEYIVYKQKLTIYDLLQILSAASCSICFVFG